MVYAENTGVSVERSKAEIEKILMRYGATSFAYGWEQGKAVIMFAMKDRHIRFLLPLPEKTDKKICKDRHGYNKPEALIIKTWEQACRSRWRSLSLAVKAKLECVEAGITSFEDEFLAHIVLPNGLTVGSSLRPKLAEAYSSGKMPTLLLGAGI